MHPVSFVLDTGATILISKDFVPTGWLSKKLRKCNSHFCLLQRAYVKPRTTSHYVTELEIYLHVNCSQ